MSLFVRGKKTYIELENDLKMERIKKIYNEHKLNIILGLEKKWEEYANLRLIEGENAFRILFNNSIIKHEVKTKLDKFEKKWSNKRIFRDDFESVFWEKIWRVCSEHSWNDSYYLYEKIEKALECAAYSLIKSHLGTDRRKANHENVVFLRDWSMLASPISVEEVLTNVWIEKCCKGKEKDILITYLTNGNSSYRDLAEMYGFKHPQQIKRILEKVINKLRKAMEEEKSWE